MMLKVISAAFAISIFISHDLVSCDRTFKIDYENDCFLKDGKPFRYIAGVMHYFRVPRVYWEDRMLKMRASGLNAVQTYIIWNLHEPYSEKYIFGGELDIEAYLDMAQKLGMLVVLRAGPYTCGERDMGGLPYWLLSANSSMELRTRDKSYFNYVERWMKVLLPKLRAFLYENGGPVISIQVENEYGSYFACDHEYMHLLLDLFRRYLGDKVVLFTTDGAAPSYLKCGTIPELYATVDFGTRMNPAIGFAAQRLYEPHGPLVNSEFYPGWLDHWGEPPQNVSSAIIVKQLRRILSMNASVSLYVFEGGTNFGFSNGANIVGQTYKPQITSYDYGAPLSEAGDPTPKYFAIRSVLETYSPLPPRPLPPLVPKFSYGKLQLSFISTIFDALSKLCPQGAIASKYPASFEEILQDYGFALYRTLVPRNVSLYSILDVPGLHDRALVFVDQKLKGFLDREREIYKVNIEVKSRQTLDILLENQGRVCFGTYLNDSKGLLSNVTLDGKVLTGWEMWPLPLNQTNILSNAVTSSLKSPKYSPNIAGFYTGTFTVPSQFANFAYPPDSYLNMQGWSHGVAFVNGFNLGRYWPVRGPQITLYVPGSVLKVGRNRLVLFETDLAPCTVISRCVVEMTASPVLNGPTP